MKYCLADFYSNERVAVKSDLLALREQSISIISDKLTPSMIYEITCIYFGLSKTKPDGGLVEYFRKNDKAFSIIENERELCLLSSYILYSNSEKSKLLNLAVITTCFENYITPLHSSFAYAYINENLKYNLHSNRASENQTLIVYPDVNFEALQLDEIDDSDADADADAEIKEFTNSDISLILREQRYYFDKLKTSLNINITRLQNQINIMREESDILWWLTRSFSDTFESDYCNLSKHQALIASAHELAELTTTTLGPASIDKIIKKAASCSASGEEEIIFKAMIELCPENTLISDDDEIKIENYPAFFPIHFALLKKKIIGDQSAWCKKYEQSIGLKTEKIINTNHFSLQMYRERLLLRLLPKNK